MSAMRWAVPMLAALTVAGCGLRSQRSKKIQPQNAMAWSMQLLGACTAR